MCERMFPLAKEREKRYVAGLSMGGYGAFKLGLVHPDRYAAAASLSGAVDVLSLIDHAEQPSTFANIYGERSAVEGSDSDLFAAARRLIARGGQMPRFYMACGTEDFLYENNQDFLRAFQAPLSITYEEGPGEHTWDFWDAYLPRVLAWMGI